MRSPAICGTCGSHVSGQYRPKGGGAVPSVAVATEGGTPVAAATWGPNSLCCRRHVGGLCHEGDGWDAEERAGGSGRVRPSWDPSMDPLIQLAVDKPGAPEGSRGSRGRRTQWAPPETQTGSNVGPRSPFSVQADQLMQVGCPLSLPA